MRISNMLKKIGSSVMATMMAVFLVVICLVEPFSVQAETSGDFDVYIYMADKILADKQFNYYTTEYETLCEIWEDELPTGFRNAVTAWESTNLILSPSDAADKAIDAKGYYIAVILEMLQSTYESDTVIKKIDSTGYIKGSTKMYNSFVDFYNAEYQVPLNEFLKQGSWTDEEKASMRKTQKEWAKNNATEIGGAMDDIFTVLDTVSDMQECVNMFASYCMVAEIGNDWEKCLQYMYDNCDKSNYPLYSALETIVNVSSSDEWNGIIYEVWKYGSEKIGAELFSYAVDAMIEKLVGQISPFVTGLQIGEAIGKGVSNVFFGTDKICESYYVVCAYCDLLEMFNDAFANAVSTYRLNKTPDNAKNVIAYVDMYFTMLNTGGVLGRKFADSIYSGGIANSLIVSKENYTDLCTKNDNILEQMKEDHKSISLRWIYDLYNENVGMYEVYASLLDTKYSDFECYVTRVEFEEEAVEWGLGDSYYWGYKCTVYPENADCKTVTYTSSDDSVAYIDKRGQVYVKGTGTCTITATSLNSSDIYDTLQVTVVEGSGTHGDSIELLTPLEPVEPESGFFTYTVSGNEATITGYSGYFANLVIPSEIDGYKVTMIGIGAFGSCTSLESVFIPEGVAKIGIAAFKYCSNLKSIHFPSTLQIIDYWAFDGCTNLTTINIPANLKTVSANSKGMFSECKKIKNIIFDENTTQICNSLFMDCTWLKCITIPDKITAIGNHAFDGCTGLTSIVIPDNVESIGFYAFSGCDNLFNVVLPKNLNYLGGCAFGGCESLKEITIPKNLTTVEITSGSGHIGSPFRACYNLKSIKFEKGTTQICDDLFYECTFIETINLPETLISIGSYAFWGCSNLKNIKIPDSVIEMGNYAFYHCESLTTITIPENVNSIGGHTFSSCCKIEEINMKNNRLASAMFNCCSGLQIINFSDTITEIPGSAFYACTSLSTVIIPESVTKIDMYAFEKCSNLTNVTIPQSVTSIGYGAFGYCPNLTIYGYKGSYAETYATNNNIPFVALSSLKITTQPTDFTGRIGDTATFTVAATGATSYQWQQNTGAGWANINTTAGKKASFSIGITAARAKYQYRCIVSDGTNTVTSTAVKMIVKESLAITTQPSNYTGKVGETATFTVAATGATSYQWQQNTGSGWANINTTAGKSASFSIGITAARANYQYRCVVSDGTTSVTSTAVKMIVKEDLAITTQPSNYTGKVGDTATFKVVATGDNLTYQWQQNTGAGWANINTTAGRKASFNIGITAARANYQYRCVVSDGTTSLTSNAVKMVIKEALAITSQPTNFNGTIGDTAKFTVGATGATSYQWQQNTGAGWTNINTSVGRSKTFSIGVTAARANYQYRCLVSDGTNTVISNAVKMVVKASLAITSQPSNYIGAIGSTAKFTVGATGATSYQWYQNTGNGWTAINTTAGRSNTFSVAVAEFRLGYMYRCVVSDGTNTLTSDEVQMYIG